MSHTDQHQSIVNVADKDEATVAAANQNGSEEKLPPCLQSIDDCWQHVFDYLRFKDIIVMGQTCERMNQTVGFYVRDYYSQLDFRLVGNEIRLCGVCLQSEFYPFIGQLSIGRDSDFNFFASVSTFDSLKALIFYNEFLTEAQIECMQHVLKNIEYVHLAECQVTDNIFEQLAKHCPKLKHLNIRSYGGVGDDLFSQYYPNFERLRIRSTVCTEIDELKMFFEKHAKLKYFETDYKFLWANRDVLNATNCQLDLLYVHYFPYTNTAIVEKVKKLLKKLFERGFYKTLQFSISYCQYDINVKYLIEAASILPRLEKFVAFPYEPSDLICLTNLKELFLKSFDSDENIEILAKGLPKLERLVLWIANYYEILTFIRHSKRLRSIKYGNSFALNLFALNQEREKLNDACQVCIYVSDHVYLPIKWNSRNLYSKLVKVFRFESFEFTKFRP